MNPETAELAIPDPAAIPAAGVHVAPAPRWVSRLRADPARMAAIAEVWRALWVSRLLVWIAGTGTVLTFGYGPLRHVFNPRGLTRGLGWPADILAAPAARWDAAWYLVIAHYGYRPDLGVYTSSRTAFFPLYPLGLRAISEFGVPPVLAGVALSIVALAFALYGIHRLCTLEMGRLGGPEDEPGASVGRWAGLGGGRGLLGGARASETARLAVLLTALAPMAFYLSAVYSEALYLALSVGVFWCAREGRWAQTALLGALAGATRSAGVVLLVPVLILYLYGPRGDRPPDFPAAAGLRPRYRLRADALWLAALPTGVLAYMGYLAARGGDPLMPFHAQEVWSRHFAGPYLGVWDGARAAFEGARQLLSMQRGHVYFPQAGGSPFVSAGHNLMLFAFLLCALPALVGVLRRLPLAYGAYVLAALALPLSYPVSSQPLMSLPRFLVVLFPLTMWLASWLAARPRARTPVLLASGLLMMFFVGQFASWHWVA